MKQLQKLKQVYNKICFQILIKFPIMVLMLKLSFRKVQLKIFKKDFLAILYNKLKIILRMMNRVQIL